MDTPTTTNDMSESPSSEETVPRRCYEELETRFRALSEQCAQLWKRLDELERSKATQHELLKQVSQLLASCLDATKNAPTRAEWNVLCATLNTTSNLLLPIAESLNASLKDSS